MLAEVDRLWVYVGNPGPGKGDSHLAVRGEGRGDGRAGFARVAPPGVRQSYRNLVIDIPESHE